MKLVGTSINNSNWKYILQVGRIWSVVCMVILLLLYLGQGAPSLDKAMELAKIYHISLDDMVENQVEIVVKEKKSGSSRLLKFLEGKKVKISGTDMELLLEAGLDWGYNVAVKVLEANDEWVRIEYTRTKENHFMKEETDGFKLTSKGKLSVYSVEKLEKESKTLW